MTSEISGTPEFKFALGRYKAVGLVIGAAGSLLRNALCGYAIVQVALVE